MNAPLGGVLGGVRVLDLTRALAGPFATMTLADLGCEVVKVEPAGGDMTRGWGPFDADGESLYFQSTNRGKRSIAIDLRDARGLALLHDMALGADVLVENFRPGVLHEMGLDYPALSARNPGLIVASISGYGRGGPYEDWPGFDQIAQGMSGLMSLNGDAATGPLRVGIPIGDLVAGMWLTIGVLAALAERARTGRGRLVETSLLGGLTGLMTFQAQRYLSLGEVPAAQGNDHPLICPYGVFEAADGPFNIAAATEAMWQTLCRVLDRPELLENPDYADNAARMRNRDALREALCEAMRDRTRAELTRTLIAAGVPAGPILRMDEVFTDPHVLASGLVAEIARPGRAPLRQAAMPVRLGPDAAPAPVPAPVPVGPPPALGGDTRAVLAGFGFDADAVGALLAAGVVREAAGGTRT